MRNCLLTLLLFLFASAASTGAIAEEDEHFVKVADPYIEMHTGPGRGYPIFYVIPRGEWVQLLYRKTSWFQVTSEDGKQGWVSAGQLAMTLNPSGKRVDIKDPDEKDFIVRNWEYGVTIGRFGADLGEINNGLAVLTLYGGYHFTENISNEIIFSQASGTAQSKTIFSLLNIVHEPFPDWTVSPFFTLGTGWIQTKPKSTLVATRDRTDQYANFGFGVRMHLTKRFLLRAEYKEYVVFTSRDDNEEIKEWKAGFGFFF